MVISEDWLYIGFIINVTYIIWQCIIHDAVDWPYYFQCTRIQHGKSEDNGYSVLTSESNVGYISIILRLNVTVILDVLLTYCALGHW